VSNYGTSSGSVPTRARFYLSPDPELTAVDALIGARTVEPLPGGGMSTATTALIVPHTLAPGPYFMGAIADADGAEEESDETNNAMSPVTVTVERAVDLLVENLTPAATTVNLGDTLNVSYVVANRGASQASTGTRLRFYLSADAIITAADTVLGARTVEALGSGATSSGDIALNIPVSLAPGAYRLGAIADANGEEEEIDESNNAFSGPAMTVIRAVDLVVTQFVPAANSVSPGQAMGIDNTVRNTGTSSTSTGTRLRFFLSTDATIDSSDRIIGARDLPNLGAGVSNTATTAVTVPPDVSPGAYHWGAIIDSDDRQVETDETNNESPAVALTVVP
jgi:serralysin